MWGTNLLTQLYSVPAFTQTAATVHTNLPVPSSQYTDTAVQCTCLHTDSSYSTHQPSCPIITVHWHSCTVYLPSHRQQLQYTPTFLSHHHNILTQGPVRTSPDPIMPGASQGHNNNSNNNSISRAPFYVKHAQLYWTSTNTKILNTCIRHPKQYVSKQPCSIIQLSSEERKKH